MPGGGLGRCFPLCARQFDGRLVLGERGCKDVKARWPRYIVQILIILGVKRRQQGS